MPSIHAAYASPPENHPFWKEQNAQKPNWESVSVKGLRFGDSLEYVLKNAPDVKYAQITESGEGDMKLSHLNYSTDKNERLSITISGKYGLIALRYKAWIKPSQVRLIYDEFDKRWGDGCKSDAFKKQDGAKNAALASLPTRNTISINCLERYIKYRTHVGEFNGHKSALMKITLNEYPMIEVTFNDQATKMTFQTERSSSGSHKATINMPKTLQDSKQLKKTGKAIKDNPEKYAIDVSEMFE
jgi:hypothetical protein